MKLYILQRDSRLKAKHGFKHLERLNINKMSEEDAKKELKAAKIILEKIGYSYIDEKLRP